MKKGLYGCYFKNEYHTNKNMLKNTIKKHSKIIVSGIVVAGFLCQYTSTFNKQEKPTLVFACKTEQECKSIVEAAKQRREKLAEEQRAIESKSAPLKEQVENLLDQLESYQTEIVVTNIEISKLKTQQEQLNVGIEQNRAKIKKRLVDTQLSVETNKTLNFIADSESLTDFIERMQVVDDLSKADSELIKTLGEQIKQLKENEEKQATHLKEVQQMTADAERLKSEKQTELNKYLEEVQQKVNEQQNQSNQAAMSEQQLKELEEAKALAERATSASNNNAGPQPAPAPGQPSRPSQPTPAPTPSNPTPAPAPSQPASSDVITTAKKYLGVPYVWGGSTPRGFDCSGFTSYVYREATGKYIGRVTTNQENAGTIIGVDQAQPGDLLFWGPRGGSYHVAIYLGNGQYIHAPHAGSSVEITNFKYFRPDFALRVR